MQKSIKNQYIDLQEGKMSQAQFLRNVRLNMPQYVTNVTSFGDTIKILRNKGILTEADIKEGYTYNTTGKEMYSHFKEIDNVNVLGAGDIYISHFIVNMLRNIQIKNSLQMAHDDTYKTLLERKV